ncbi:MAG: sugar phosphate nucleotidyltransferase [Thermoproteota archaeon]
MNSVFETSKIVGGILCGGYGKRLWPLTNVLPKVLLKQRVYDNGQTAKPVKKRGN